MGRISGLALPHPREPLATAMWRKKGAVKGSQSTGSKAEALRRNLAAAAAPSGRWGQSATGSRRPPRQRESGWPASDKRRLSVTIGGRKAIALPPALSLVATAPDWLLSTGPVGDKNFGWLPGYILASTRFFFCLNQPDLYCFVAYTHAQMTQLIIVLCE